MTITRRLFLGGGSALVAVGGSEWFQPSYAQSGVLNLYSARHYDTDRKIYDGFTQKTGIKVNLIEGKAEELVERIKSEGGNSPADVLITTDAGNIWLAQEQGLFQAVSSRILIQRIPASLRDPKSRWFGLSRRARVLVYNRSKVNPRELSSYEALANPKWRGRILVRSSSNVYNRSLVAAMIADIGAAKTEQWMKGLVANFARQPQGGDIDQIRACASGVGDVAIVNNYYLVWLAKSTKREDKVVSEKMGLFFPNQGDRGTHVNICGGGVIRSAPNKQAAIKFLEYLTTNEAQQIFSRSNNEYPVVRGVPIDPVVAGYGNFKSDPLNVSNYGRFQSQAIKLMDRAGWR